MHTFDEIVKALQSGSKVTCYGNTVTLEGCYDWQEKKLRINLSNGSSYIADGRDVQSMKIEAPTIETQYCHECGEPFVIDDQGIATHTDKHGLERDHDADADHVPFSLEA